MFAKNIATVYFYVISAGSLILIVIGIFSAVNFIVNSTQYEKYPAPFFQQFNCDFNPSGPYGPYPPAAVPLPANGEKIATFSTEESEKIKRACEQKETEARRQYKINDLKNGITFPLVGLILFAIHFPIALNRSKESKS